MPDMWMLDGVFITWDERRVWKTGSPIPKDVKTRFVDLIDRELEPFTTGFISSQERKSELSKDTAKKTKIWSLRAREVLEDMPYAFEMGVEEDMARLRVLAMDLERTVARGFGKAVKNPDIMHGSVLEIISGEETYEGRTALNVHGIGSRAILALLLLGTFSPEFGSDSLQRTLETVFITRWDANERHAGGVDHWARPETSPMNWRSEDRLTYLALLVGKLTLDSISETSVREAPPLVSPEKLIALGGILRHLLRASYAAKRSGSSGNQPTNEPDSGDMARLARSNMSKDHTRQLAALHLDILQLLCLDDRDVRQFCHDFLHMAEVLVAALYALLPEDHILHSDATSIVDDAKMQCAEDGAATLSLDARALQMKFRMCSLIEDVVAYIDSVQGQE
ncbi:hypothetical protein PhCBS80983_g03954 [Powellomyces hirtus]|uniref:Uncharacterized protein n=1 Tax=Powellomyces hirtus TaxID=109895 RepID=A0A507E2A9_9FUNG|nr:hypothetical protein PhCBS80983_g03954 [Powellomyces hirtus]